MRSSATWSAWVTMPMSQTPTSLAEMPVTGGRPRVFNLPSGWYLPGGDGVADPVAGQGLDAANGILVQSKESPGVNARRIAVWNPRTGTVEVIGRARAVIDAYTPPGARLSLLAWLPAGCLLSGGCLMKITDTANGAVTTVRSPSAGGFAVGGASLTAAASRSSSTDHRGARRGSPSSSR